MINSTMRLPPESLLERGSKIAFICALHLLAFGMLAQAGLRPQMVENLLHLDVRVIEDKPPIVQPQKPKPLPATRSPVPMRPVEPQPARPLMTAAAEAPASPASFTVPPQPAAQPTPEPVRAEPAPAPAPPAIPAPITGARFDADYLRNPAPAYPPAARRRGDQGRVLLRVLVSAQGAASSVQIQNSSGYPRLDEVALETVRQWSFVPAKRGAQAIEDWVLVPIVFRLDS